MDELEETKAKRPEHRRLEERADLLKRDPRYKKNFYYHPRTHGSRAQMMEGINLCYLLQLCYGILLTIHLDGPYLLMPSWLTRLFVLIPNANQVGGTVEASCLAMKYGWAINLGGGFANTSARRGFKNGAYCDVRLAINNARQHHMAERSLIINTNALFGEAMVDEFSRSRRVFMMDVYNPQVTKVSESKLKKVHVSQQVTSNDSDESYVSKCQFKAQEAISVYNPNIIIYVAGYDVLAGDHYGRMKLTEGAVIARDEEIMRTAITRGIPIVMLIGNTFKSSSGAIANSIRNVLYKCNISKAPIKYPTADRMRGMQGGGQGLGMRAAVDQDLR